MWQEWTEANSGFVLPRASDPSRNICKEMLENAWQRVRAHAVLEGLRLHDQRRAVETFASRSGSKAFMISHLLKHKKLAITNRCVNPDADRIRALSGTINSLIEAGLKGEGEFSDVFELPDTRGI